MDSYGNQQTSAGGTTAAGSEPAFTHCWTGGTQTDGTVTWTTTVGEPSNIWRASKPYSLTCQMSIWDTNGNVETVTTAGTSGASAPTWPAAGCGGTGVTTTDGTVTWTCSPGTSVIKAAIVSTGGEDFPFNSFYGSSQSPLGSMGSGEAGVLDINSSTLGLYRLFIHEPIYFNQSLAVYEENGDSSEITFTGNATWAANVIFANNDTN